MVKMTPEQEAEYALGFGSPGATCRGLRRKPMTAWWNSGHPVGPGADACASGQIGLLRRLPLQHPGAAARRRTRRRLRPVLRRKARGLRGSQRRFPSGSHTRSAARIGARRVVLGQPHNRRRAAVGLVRAACPTGPVRRAGHAAAVLHDTETGNGRIRTFS
jgi:hypothetical protein